MSDYTKEMSAGTFNANVSLFYTDTVYFDSDERIHQGPYGLVNAQMSNDPGGNRWTRHLNRLVDLLIDDAVTRSMRT